MRFYRELSRRGEPWVVEALTDWACWMVGFNFYARRSNVVRGLYLHIGPIILGVYQDRL